MATPNDIELHLDAGGLYREEVFTDQKIGTIRQLFPVKSDGSPDPGRAVIFAGQMLLLDDLLALTGGLRRDEILVTQVNYVKDARGVWGDAHTGTAARLVSMESPPTFTPICRLTIASGTVDIPTASAPIPRRNRISAGVS